MRSWFAAIVFCSMLGAASTVFAAGGPKDGLVATEKSQVDADYAIQGEYAGKHVFKEGKATPVGVQLIARGDGDFDAVCYIGGLPGDGWNREDPMFKGTATRLENGGVVLKDPEGNIVSKLVDGVITSETPTGTGAQKRIVRVSPTMGAEPPEGATVIVGKGVNRTDGQMNTEDQLWSGATTTDQFEGPYTLHLEFLLPYMPKHRGQARSNSGVYIHDCYELQVLDSFGLEGMDNECGGIYKVQVPKVNMCLPPLQWQTYDIDFTPPEFDDEGNRTKQAVLTVKHNGVVIHDNLALEKTPGRQAEGPGPRPIHLQQHGNKVQYRNVWLKEK